MSERALGIDNPNTITEYVSQLPEVYVKASIDDRQ